MKDIRITKIIRLRKINIIIIMTMVMAIKLDYLIFLKNKPKVKFY